MPTLNPTGGRPRAGTVASFIRWHMERGDSRRTAERLAKARFPSVANRVISSAVDHFQAMQRKARNVERGRPNTPIIDPPSVGSRTGARTHRIGVDFDFDEPGKGRKHFKGLTVDVPAGLTKDEAKKYIRDLLIREFRDKYEIRSATAGEIGRRIRNITIATIEGL